MRSNIWRTNGLLLLAGLALFVNAMPVSGADPSQEGVARVSDFTSNGAGVRIMKPASYSSFYQPATQTGGCNGTICGGGACNGTCQACGPGGIGEPIEVGIVTVDDTMLLVGRAAIKAVAAPIAMHKRINDMVLGTSFGEWTTKQNAMHRARNQYSSDQVLMALGISSSYTVGSAGATCGPSGCVTPPPSKWGYFVPTGCGGAGCPPFGQYNMVYSSNPQYFDSRDGRVYAAQGYGAPVSVPLAPNVEHTYNYGWGMPSSRLTPVSRLSPYTAPIMPAW